MDDTRWIRSLTSKNMEIDARMIETDIIMTVSEVRS